ncbi:molybdopterin cofactor sulfurase mosc [Holotrichia oblita]|uniref:Molybdopterin cofactor sulfurase mosc n=1 Tax=Holotrichia oblita TaxID=644536 RepID=A0ACB9SQI0_HOLOL|nr:molybdopterin cofactor sulfurase mosc [Holotrichia oblita]
MQKYKQIYTKEQEIQISAEFTRMKDICYLEHAGATLYSEKQMSEIFRDLSSNIYANPHAKSTTSKLTEDSIDQIRFQILNHFNTNSDEYSVIFTSGATAYLQDNHTSVLGMRNNASNIKMLEHNQAFDLLNSDSINIISDNTENSLFVYPAQCNFSGTKYPLHWIDKVQRGSLNRCTSREMVLHIANLFGVQLRTGCFCNPGSCQRHLKLSTNDVIKQYEKGHVCGDQNDLIDGTPTGSVRISFGYMSTKKDADNFLKVIEDCFVETPCLRKIPDNFKIMTGNYNKKFSSSSNYNKQVEADVKIDKKVINSRSTSENSDHDNLATNTITITGTLDNIFIYPIKSCGAFKIENNWRLVPTGLEYDREWMIVNASGVCLTQKSNANLCKIKPYINLENDELELRFENLQKISIPLSRRESLKLKIFPCHSKVCGDPIIGWDCGQEVADWLSTVLNETGLRLLKQSSSDANIRTKNIKGELVKLSLANQAQFLLINKSSIEWLKNYLIDDNPKGTIDDLIDRFRANFVVNFDKPFIENDLRDMKVSQLSFRASGKCNRCQIICINQDTGEKSVDLLRILSKEFQGKYRLGCI